MMARRSASPPPPKQPAYLSAQQIKTAIPKLERRLKELEQVLIGDWSDEIRNRLDGLQKKVEDTLVDVFGPDTLEYQRFQVYEFSRYLPMTFGEGISPREYMRTYEEAIAKAAQKLHTALELLNEKLVDMGETPGGRALQAYQGLELHPEIDRVASALYRGGHYANAVEDSVKALNALVRLRSGLDDIDGSSLMQRVFSPDNPLLRFNALADESDKNEQRGYMMMFSGAVAGLRNPRALKLIQDDPERALEFIAFVSLLAKLLDGAQKP
jgi:uncharacterized protein (TIGR02391 family)